MEEILLVSEAVKYKLLTGFSNMNKSDVKFYKTGISSI